MRHSSLSLDRAVLRNVDDSKKWQELQAEVFKDEPIAAIERVQQFGLTSVPEPGAEAILSYIGGSRSHPVILAVDDRRYRPRDLPAGTTALYNADGSILKLVKGKGPVLDGGDEVTHLGGDPDKGHVFAPVMTTSGPSPFVKARIA